MALSYLQLKSLGYADPRLYSRGWSHWGKSPPVAEGDGPWMETKRCEGKTRGESMTCLLRAWTSHEAELRGWLRQRAHDRDSADDLLQEVFLRAAARQQAFCDLTNPRAWLFAVARNALIDRHRASRTLTALPDDLTEQIVSASASDETAPLDALADCLPQVLARLAPADRRALTLCDLEGAPQQQLAKELGLLGRGQIAPATGARTSAQAVDQRLPGALRRPGPGLLLYTARGALKGIPQRARFNADPGGAERPDHGVRLCPGGVLPLEALPSRRRFLAGWFRPAPCARKPCRRDPRSR